MNSARPAPLCRQSWLPWRNLLCCPHLYTRDLRGRMRRRRRVGVRRKGEREVADRDRVVRAARLWSTAGMRTSGGGAPAWGSRAPYDRGGARSVSSIGCGRERLQALGKALARTSRLIASPTEHGLSANRRSSKARAPFPDVPTKRGTASCRKGNPSWLPTDTKERGSPSRRPASAGSHGTSCLRGGCCSSLASCGWSL